MKRLEESLNKKKKISNLICKILLKQLSEMELIKESIGINTIENIIPMYIPWMKETIRTLIKEDLIEEKEDNVFRIKYVDKVTLSELWETWYEEKKDWINDKNLKGQLILLENMLKQLPEILIGNIPATVVMFPDSSSKLVEAVYKDNDIVELFNEEVSMSVNKYIKKIIDENRNNKIRIIEIGAGTGATTVSVLNKLNEDYSKYIEEYCFTDISQTFLDTASPQFDKYTFMKYKKLNIEENIEAQGYDSFSYDLVLATNVLHATKNIKKTIRNSKCLLKKNGQIIINELSENSILTHLTFGLLEGWWLSEDPSVRIEGSPVLSPANWQKVLRSEGYQDIKFPQEINHKLGEQIVIGCSNGMIRPLPSKAHVNTAMKNQEENEVNNETLNELMIKTNEYLVEVICSIIKIPKNRLKENEPLGNYGMDSLMIIKLNKELKKSFNKINTSVFFQCQTIHDLSEFLIKNEKENLLKVLNISKSYNDKNEEIEYREKNISNNVTENKNIDDIAIIGVDGKYPKANNVREFWDNLCKSQNCITEIPKERWNWQDYYTDRNSYEEGIYTKWGGFISDFDKFDPLFFKISPSEAEDMDPQERLFLEVSYGAIEDAGYTPQNISSNRKVGVFVGVMNSDYVNGSNYWSIANRVSYTFDFKGPSIAIDTACSSSLTAIHLAVESLKNGSCDSAIVGGVNLILDPQHLIRLSSMNMLSEGDKCRAFGVGADGFIDSEGIGAIVLKPLKLAIEDGDNIYGTIKSTSINSGGKTNGYTVPNLNVQTDLIDDALNRANIDPRRISYIEAHGTGTSLGDPIEFTALTNAFRKKTSENNFCSLGSVKSNIGHCEGAAGIAAITKVILQMKYSTLVPTINAEEINEDIILDNSPFYLQNKCTEWIGEELKISGISSFGAGGANGHIILEEYKNANIRYNSKPTIIVISARNDERLEIKCRELFKYINSENLTDTDLVRISYTLQVGREVFDSKIGFVVNNINELKQKLKDYISKTFDDNEIIIGNKDFENSSVNILNNSIDTKDVINTLWNTQKYIDIIKLWCGGMDINWCDLYKNTPISRISLPTYPFEKKKYWKVNKRINTHLENFENLFIQKNESNFTAQKYINNFNSNFDFIKDHKLYGKNIIAGTVYIEMVTEAINASLDGAITKDTAIVIEYISISKMVEVSENTKISVRLNRNEGQKIKFEIINEKNSEKISFGVASIIAKEKINFDIKDNFIKCLSSEEFYKLFSDNGLNYGEYYRRIESIKINEKDAFAILNDHPLDNKNIILNPGILDSSIQGVITLILNSQYKENGYLPYELKNIKIFNKLTTKCKCSIKLLEENENSFKFRIDIFNFENEILVSLEEITLVKVNNNSEEDENGCLRLYTPKWIEKSIEENTIYNTSTAIILNCKLNFNELDAAFPNRKIISLNHNENSLDLAYEKYSLDILNILKKELSSNNYDKKLIQLVIEDTENNKLLEGLYPMLKTAAIESPNVDCQLIISENKLNEFDLGNMLKANEKCIDNVIKYKLNKRYVQLQENVVKKEEQIFWKNKGVYLIVGGYKGIGYIVAKEIATKVKNPTLVLLGRSEINSCIEENIGNLKDLGAEVIYKSVDITNSKMVKDVMESIYNSYKSINGIIHSAGIIKDNLIVNKNNEEFKEVLSPKIKGLVNLDKASKDYNLDFLILFSSIASDFGNIGQVDYVTANGFLNNYSSYRNLLVKNNERRGRTLSIKWPIWKDGTMKLEELGLNYIRNNIGIIPMENEDGIKALYEAWNSEEDEVSILYGNKNKIADSYLLNDSRETKDVKSAHNLINNNSEIVEKEVQKYLKEIISSVTSLTIEEIDSSTTFDNYGIDSIRIMKMMKKLEEDFGTLPKSLFFKYRSIDNLTGYFSSNHNEKLKDLIKVPIEVTIENAGIDTKNEIINIVKTEEVNFKENRSTDIAIVGVSGIYPGAKNINEFWENLKSGKDSVTEIPEDRWDYNIDFSNGKGEKGKTYCKMGGFIDGVYDFDPLFFNISPKEAELMNPQEKLFLQCVYETMEDAGYIRNNTTFNNKRTLSGSVGVYVGVMYEEYQLIGAEQTLLGNPMALSGISASIANRVSYYFNFTGPSMAVSTMCSSSLVAINLACESILNGSCEAAIAGGVNVSIHPNKFLILSEGGFASENGRCSSFGAEGDGYVPAEGVGSILLKPLNKAIEDGDNIYGVIKSTFVNHGGKTNGFTVPNPTAQTEVISRALNKANINPKIVNYIETHGTGTPLGDPIEIESLSEAFNEYNLENGSCSIGSVKSNIGHCESAAAVASLTKVLLQIKHKKIVPSLHSKNLNKDINFSKIPFYVQQELSSWNRVKLLENNHLEEKELTAGISAFGAGGTNGHMIVQEFTPSNERINNREDNYIFILSGKDKNSLISNAQNLFNHIDEANYSFNEMLNISYTLLLGREEFEERLGIIAASVNELKVKLNNFIKNTVDKDIFIGNIQAKNDLSNNEYNIEILIRNKNYKELLSLWINGVKVNWNNIFEGKDIKIISLPSYSFDKEYCKVEEIRKSLLAQNEDKVLLVKSWEKYTPKSSDVSIKKAIVLMKERNPKLEEEINKYYNDAYILTENNLSEAREDKIKDYNLLIDLSGCSYEQNRNLQWTKLVQIFIDRENKDKITLIGITKALESYKNNTINLSGAIRASFYKSVNKEYSYVRSIHLDVEDKTSDEETLEIIQSVISSCDKYSEICIRDNSYYKSSFKEETKGQNYNFIINSNDVLVVLGGTKGLGYITTKHLIQEYKFKKVVLVGRDKIPPRNLWGNLESYNTSLNEKINNIIELENLDVEVKSYSLDIGDKKEVSKVFNEIRNDMGQIGMLVHSAGVVDWDTPAFLRKTENTIKSILKPKVEGLMNIINETKEDDICVTLLYSSVSASIPTLSIGQLDYTMANGYMNYMAESLKSQRRIISIQWPSWKEIGFGEVKNKKYIDLGLKSITNQEGLNLLDNILRNSSSNVVMPLIIEQGKFNISHLSENKEIYYEKNVFNVENRHAERYNGNNDLVKPIQKLLIDIISQELKIKREKLDITKSFQYYGVDSIMLVQIIKRINKVVEEEVNPSILFEHTSIEKLSIWLSNKYEDKFKSIFKVDNNETSENHSIKNVKIDNEEKIIEEKTFIQSNNCDIAIVGMSCKFGGANNLDEYWNLLSEGKTSIKRIPFNKLGYETNIHAGIIDNIDNFDYKKFFIPREDADLMDPQSKILLEECLKTIEDAGYSIDEVKGKEIGVFIGGRSQNFIEREQLTKAKNPIVIVGQNYLSANISNFFDFTGKSMVIDTACSSALVAIDLAIDSIRKGDIEGALVGGVNILSSDGPIEIFNQRGLLSKDSKFHILDGKANGMLLGEGVGVIYLKSLDQAVEDKDDIYAVIKGIGVNNDGRTMGPATPNLQAQKSVIEKALRNSGKLKNNIEYIECNGSGSEITDLLELKVIDDIYGHHNKKISIGCTKPNIGHTLCAEGIAALIKVTLMIKNRKIVPFISGNTPMKHFNINESSFEFIRDTTSWESENHTVALNCFADGGTNVHLILDSFQGNIDNHYTSNKNNVIKDMNIIKEENKTKISIWKKMKMEN